MKNLKIKRAMADGSVLSFKLSDTEMYNAYQTVMQSYRKEDAKNAFRDYMTELIDEFPVLLKMPFIDLESELPRKKIRKQIIKTMAEMFTNNASISETDEWYGLARDVTASYIISPILDYLSGSFREKNMPALEKFIKQQVNPETGTIFLRKKEYDITEILGRKKSAKACHITPKDLIILQNEDMQPANDAQTLLLALEFVLLTNPDTKFWHLLKFLQEKEN